MKWIYILFVTWKYLYVEFVGKVQVSGIPWCLEYSKSMLLLVFLFGYRPIKKLHSAPLIHCKECKNTTETTSFFVFSHSYFEALNPTSSGPVRHCWLVAWLLSVIGGTILNRAHFCPHGPCRRECPLVQRNSAVTRGAFHKPGCPSTHVLTRLQILHTSRRVAEGAFTWLVWHIVNT